MVTVGSNYISISLFCTLQGQGHQALTWEYTNLFFVSLDSSIPGD